MAHVCEFPLGRYSGPIGTTSKKLEYLPWLQ
jgi:hypothetical protein